MGSSYDPKISALEHFLEGHPKIEYVTPNSPNYSTLRATYRLDNPAIPLAIVRPQNADDVASIIKYARANGIKPVVRSGGHSLFGQSMVQDALIVDMRDIAYVKIDGSNTTASVGGGIIMGDLADQLTKEGLVTPVGTIPTVGFVGWSTYGGYGPFSAQYGLGCDNVVGAKVVNWKGEVVEADKDMLKGIRGAGGAFGPIVEMTVKVYPLKNILAGMVIYDSTDIATTAQKFSNGYKALADQLPPALSVQQLVMNSPMGKIFAAALIWGSDDHEAGQAYVAKIAALGNVVMNTVAPNTVAGFMQFLATVVPPNAYGSIETISIRELTPEAIAIMARNFERMPTTSGTASSIHELRGPSTTPNGTSVFGSREPHFMFEIIKTVAEKADMEDTEDWAKTFMAELRKMDSENILPGTYISLTPPGSNSSANIFGSNYKSLLELKRKYDPEGTFGLAPPEVYTLQ